ncbi:MAG: UDP-glucose:undecaprenyl-phosphate glucose-1-phosphate transferase [Chloroflexi bacterium ADurb.Bin325]|nr:MAG: UDP-glucose:undecaprenyl-phosphate glucose-1-phosphate transferase [Chloroflexi bacterium ADurb.Bin325]
MTRDVRRWMPWVTAVTDVLLISVALLIAYWLRYDRQLFRLVDPANNVPFSVYLPLVGVLTVIWLAASHRAGAYDVRRGRPLLDELYSVVNATTLAIMLMVVLVFFYRRLFYSRIIFVYAGIAIVVLVGLARGVRQVILTRLRQAGQGVDRVVIIGAGEVGRTVIRNLIAQPELGYRVVGFLDDDPAKSTTDIGPIRALGPLDNLSEVIREQAIDQVIITLPWQYHRKTVRLVTDSEHAGVRARVVPDLFQLSLGGVDVEAINGIPLISIKETRLTGVNLALKRIVDVFIAGAVMLVGSPVWLLVALAIKLDSPGPVLFRQERVGRDGHLFTVYKFRSMYVDAEQRLEELRGQNEASGPLFKVRDDPRRTRVGRFIRTTSIDEIPQFLNVLRGEMSIVGPRPGLPNEVAQYQEWHHKRLQVLPGITGLWQVSGRSNLTFDEMVMLDIYYAENWSLSRDLRIMLRTVPQILFGDGAY